MVDLAQVSPLFLSLHAERRFPTGRGGLPCRHGPSHHPSVAPPSFASPWGSRPWRSLPGPRVPPAARIRPRTRPRSCVSIRCTATGLAPTAAFSPPIAEQELRVGCVYNHFSARLNRRVWAIWQGGRVLARCSAQPRPNPHWPWTSTSRSSAQEQRNKLTKEQRDLLKKVEREPGQVFCSLVYDPGEKALMWKLDPTAGHATIYDAETQYRWEWAYGRYMRMQQRPLRFSVVGGRWPIRAGGRPAIRGFRLRLPDPAMRGRSSPADALAATDQESRP